MSVSDGGSRPSPPAAGLGPYGDRGRPRSKRGRWVLGGVGVVFVLGTAWIITHSGPDKAAGGPGGGAAGAGAAGAAGGRGGGRGGRGGGGGGFGGGVTPVGAAQAATGDVPVYVSALGTVTPAATVTVRTQIAGQLFSTAFQEGQQVSKGQLLAQVDPRPYQQALAQAQGTLQRDQAQLENARLDLKRYQTLLAQDSIARQQVDTQGATVRQLEGGIATDRAAVGAAKLNLSYTRVTSPISGKVGLRQVDAGNYVTTGDANGLVTVTQVDPIDVVFTIPEDQVPKVNARMRATRLAVTALDRGQKAELASGVLSTLDNQIDTTTGTVKAKARFQNGGGQLYPNQFVNVRLLLDTLHASVTAPTSAVLRGQQGLFVYVVDQTRTVHVRNITTGPAAGELTAITAGLAAGETVVTDGSDRLKEGAKVSLPGDCPPSFPAGGAGGRGGRGGRGAAAAGGAAVPAKLSWLDKLLGKKPPPAPATRPGFDANGQRCRPVNYGFGAGGGAGGQSQTAQLIAQLNLDAGQKAKVETITAAMRGQMAAMRESGDYQGMRGLRENMNKQIEAVLRPDQVAKFRQLQAEQRARFQGGGSAGGFGAAAGGPAGAPGGAAPAPTAPPPTGAAPAASPAPAATTTAAAGAPAGPRPSGGGGGGGGRGGALFDQLNLDAAQKGKVDAIRAEYGPRIRDAYGAGDMAAAGAVRKEMGDKIDAVLRPDQRAKYKALREEMRGRMGGGGGGPPGGG